MVKFADVARPGVFLEHLQRAWLKSGDSFAIPQCMLAQEVRRQGRNVFAPLAQRRELNFDRVQPEQKVLPEPAGLDFAPHIGVGRRQQPDIGAPRLGGTDPFEIARLQDPQ